MLDKSLVFSIARLARLKLTEEEAVATSAQLSAILSNFEAIAEVPTQGVEPLITPSEIEVHLRADAVNPHCGQSSVDELLSVAPDKSGHLYKVPPVV